MKLNFDKIKPYIIFVFIAILVITIHEFGHLFVSRSVGLNVNEMTVGIGIPYLEILNINFNIGNITIHLKPIIIGGYVTMPDEFESIEFYKKFLIYIAGCIFNTISGILVLIGLGLKNKETPFNSLKKSIYFLLSLITIEDMTNRALNNEYIETLEEGNRIQRFLCLFSTISLVVAIINLLPIFPLDGGRIIFDSMINADKLGIVIMASAINYHIINDRKKIITKIKEYKEKRVLAAL